MKSNKLLTGILASIVMLAVIPASSAFAQQAVADIDIRHYKPVTVLAGTGAAVDDDRGYRTHFRLMMTSEDDTFEVKRGVFLLKHDSARKIAHVVPDSWTVELTSDGEILNASGELESANGRVFEVKLEGEKIAELANGTLFFVKGKVSDGETTLDLYYIAALHTRDHRISPAVSAAP